MKTGNIVSIEANHLMEPGDGALLMRKSKAIKTIQDAFYHDFDLLNWLVDSLPVQVASFGAFDVFNPRKINSTMKVSLEIYNNQREVPVCEVCNPFSADVNFDNELILMEYRNGSRVSLHINTHSTIPQRRMLICGTEGTIEGIIRYRHIDDPVETTIEVTPGDSHGGSDHELMENVMLAMQGDPQFSHSGQSILPTAVTSLAIDRSRKERSIITLDDIWSKLGL